MKTIWLFLRPSILKVILLAVMLVIASYVVTKHEATSKVSWQENRGIPLSFLIISGYTGPCSPRYACQELKVQKFQMITLLLDIISWYIISCLVVLVCESVKWWRGADKSGT